jgi:undecaprenyl-diphosphatase
MTTLRRRLRRAALPLVPFAALTLDVVCHGAVDRLERSRTAGERRRPGLWPAVTKLGDRPALVAMALTAAVVSHRRGRPAWRPVLPVLAGIGVRLGLMELVGRDRPPKRLWLEEADAASYPSRHTTCCALGVMALRDAMPPSAAFDLLAAATVGTTAYSRLRLGVHWPSDVVGGLLLAAGVHALLTDPRPD